MSVAPEPPAMTRFDAATADERRKLFVDAIGAHRERGTPYLTVETGPPAVAGEDAETDPEADLEAVGDADAPFEVDDLAEGEDGASSEGSPDEGDGGPAWIQFGDDVINLDCTEAELDRLKSLLDRYPAFRIDELTRPDEAEGVNVRVTARADANRIAGFLDDVFLTVYDRPDDYRAWVVEI